MIFRLVKPNVIEVVVIEVICLVQPLAHRGASIHAATVVATSASLTTV